MSFVYHIDLGITDYSYCWEIQKKINHYKQKNKCNDVIITTEHHHVYTLGKGGTKDHLLIDETSLRKDEISYYEIDRGGDLTYHGPGQLVCYPIFDLNNYNPDSHKYLRDLEDVIIFTLKEYGITARKDEEYTGVWVEEEKICAIGIKISRWITMHGLALNVSNDLKFFDNIIPCGIFHKGVTSMQKLTGKKIELSEVIPLVLKNMELVFGIQTKKILLKELFSEFIII